MSCKIWEIHPKGEFGVFRNSLISAQREELEKEIGNLEAEAEKVAEEARELTEDVPS
jgi:cell division protein FtsB